MTWNWIFKDVHTFPMIYGLFVWFHFIFENFESFPDFPDIYKVIRGNDGFPKKRGMFNLMEYHCIYDIKFKDLFNLIKIYLKILSRILVSFLYLVLN